MRPGVNCSNEEAITKCHSCVGPEQGDELRLPASAVTNDSMNGDQLAEAADETDAWCAIPPLRNARVRRSRPISCENGFLPILECEFTHAALPRTL